MDVANIGIKPKIVWDPGKKQWRCHDNYYMNGFGDTLKAAYDDWKVKANRFAVVPRRGIINQRSCRYLASRGCFPLRSYVGHQQLYAYLWQEDMLLLRG